jgi:hypothetical protein
MLYRQGCPNTDVEKVISNVFGYWSIRLFIEHGKHWLKFPSVTHCSRFAGTAILELLSTAGIMKSLEPNTRQMVAFLTLSVSSINSHIESRKGSGSQEEFMIRQAVRHLLTKSERRARSFRRRSVLCMASNPLSSVGMLGCSLSDSLRLSHKYSFRC